MRAPNEYPIFMIRGQFFERSPPSESRSTIGEAEHNAGSNLAPSGIGVQSEGWYRTMPAQ